MDERIELYMNSSIETADFILAHPVPGRLPIDVFRAILKIWFGEKDKISRPPSFKISTFGIALGLDRKIVEFEIQFARWREERMNMAMTGGKRIGMNVSGKTFKFIATNKIQEF